MHYECLETRKLLSVSLDGNVLLITGTEQDDQIVVSRYKDLLQVEDNGELHSFVAADVQEIQANLLGGDDSFIVRPMVMPVTVDGGDGDDYIKTSMGNDIIYTGDGNDSVWAGDGDDLIISGEGSSIVNGGAGDDFLTGGAGADVFEFRSAHGVDVITDFSAEDRLMITSAGTTPAAIIIDIHGVREPGHCRIVYTEATASTPATVSFNAKGPSSCD